MKEIRSKIVVGMMLITLILCVFFIESSKTTTMIKIYEYKPNNQEYYDKAVGILEKLNIKEIDVQTDNEKNFTADFSWFLRGKDETNATITIQNGTVSLYISDDSSIIVSEFYSACMLVLANWEVNAMSFRNELTAGEEITGSYEEKGTVWSCELLGYK